MPAHNNYYCSSTACDYHTHQTTGNLADKQLEHDGGMPNQKTATCPKCKCNTLVFLYETGGVL